MIRTRHALTLLALATASCTAVTVKPQDRKKSPRAGHLDATRGFYYPGYAKRPDAELATYSEGAIDTATYARYLLGQLGTRQLEDLAFDIFLAQECHARKLARNAPLLARSAASRRFYESGRRAKADPDGTQQRKFINEAMRKMRVDALAGAKRRDDPKALRDLFDRRFGVGGERVRVRHVLVSLRGTQRRLERAGESTTPADIDAAARTRARELTARASAGDFASLLPESDDRITRNQLRTPDQAAQAGELWNYNYQRFGREFATAVRKLKPGQSTGPVRSSVGYHVIQLLDRRVTRFADVAGRLREELGRGSAKPVEVTALRRELFVKYRYAPSQRPN